MLVTSTDAFLLVDKPAGITSFDVVRQVGRALGTRRAGHTGTLDPFATGLLLVLTGRSTRLIRFVPSAPKVYLAEIVFGSERDTDDATGVVTREAPLPEPAIVLAQLPQLSGTLSQVPPAYSAKKVGGRRSYALARRGEEVPLAPARVDVHRWEPVEVTPGRLQARITCGSGTYIRALARDLGRLAGSAAHLAALRRERIGPFDVADAQVWGELCEGTVRAHDVAFALGMLPSVVVGAEDRVRLCHGAAIGAGGGGAHPAVVVKDSSGAVVAVARGVDGRLEPMVVLADA